MILLKVKTLKHTKEAATLANLGIENSSIPVEVQTFINITQLTHFEENKDDRNLTNIYLTSGALLITSMDLTKFTSHLVHFLGVDDLDNEEDHTGELAEPDKTDINE